MTRTLLMAVAIAVPATVLAEEPPRLVLPSVIPMTSVGMNTGTPISLSDPSGGIGIDPEIALSPENGFYRTHFLPRLTDIMGNLKPHHAEHDRVNGPVADEAFEDLTDLTHRCFAKATRRAVRGYMLESSGLDEQARRYKEGIAGNSDNRRRQARVRFRLGVSHARPELQLRCRIGRYSGLRMALRANGKIGVEFDRAGTSWARMYAGYDRRDGRYEMAMRLGF